LRRRFPQLVDFTRRKGGAGDRGLTGEVQLWKGTETDKDEVSEC
jgi:hypothetical protein